MLSILIPTFNYSVYPLVQQLARQATDENIVFEILVFDDASQDPTARAENENINLLPNSKYHILPKNIGRSAIRNLLAEKARYEWLLFLDADTLPTDGNLIKNYLKNLKPENSVLYGGIKYQEENPGKAKILRWKYGNEREAVACEERIKNQHLSLLTLNFCIQKSVFEKVCFNENLPNLRCEDTMFSFDLKKNNIPVLHINNPVYHNGIETSEIFLNKSEESLLVIKYIVDNNVIEPEYTKMTKWYHFFKNNKMIPLIKLWHKFTRKPLRKSLLGKNPSLFIFDLYRIGYLCNLSDKK